MEAGADRRLMAEIAREAKAGPMRVGPVPGLEDFPGTVAGAVVYADDFVVGRLRGGGQAEPFKQGRQHGFFIEAKDDGGNFF